MLAFGELGIFRYVFGRHPHSVTRIPIKSDSYGTNNRRSGVYRVKLNHYAQERSENSRIQQSTRFNPVYTSTAKIPRNLTILFLLPNHLVPGFAMADLSASSPRFDPRLGFWLGRGNFPATASMQ